MRFSLFVLPAGCIGGVLGSSPIQVPWTTDPIFSSDPIDRPFTLTFGPDGPWQAVVIGVGNFTNLTTGIDNDGVASRSSLGLPVPLYPCGSGKTQLLPAGFGGNYSISGSNASTTARKSGDAEANPDDWFASVMLNSSSSGMGVTDIVQFVQKLSNDNPNPVNSSIFVATQGWNISLPSGRSYANRVGVLGLGRDSDMSGPGGLLDGLPSILDQLKTAGSIGSSSFGLQIGSVAQQISGSLILGGYDQSRTIGPVGVFSYITGLPAGALMDVTLGAARCDSPFGGAPIAQLYKGTGDNQASQTIIQTLGAPRNAAIVVPNPASPYISLPLGTCEAVASHLPVTWNADIGFYTWNKNDPKFAQIVDSSAYMEFILTDATATNISIKVPFTLLNLTLESPIVDTPTPYFPCQPLNSSYGFWALGRAFLQSAFLGVNYDLNKTFLAQAPGPNQNQSVIHPIDSSDDSLNTIQPDALGSLVTSWQDTWSSPNCSGGSSASTVEVGMASDDGLGRGAIAGIVVVVVVVLAAIAGAFFYLRRRRRVRARATAAATNASSSSEPMVVPQATKGPVEADGVAGARKAELPADRARAELAQAQVQEVAGNVRHEAGGEEARPRFELPAEGRN